MTQQGDVLLYQTTDDGEINVDLGRVEMSGGLETSVYLSLFGGNEDDAGGSDKRFTWWGNLTETLPERTYRSETQNLLRALPASSGNLRRIEDAVKRDLAWMVTVGAASSIAASVSIPGVNKVKIAVVVTAEGEETEFIFAENWKAAV